VCEGGRERERERENIPSVSAKHDSWVQVLVQGC
jgi:hypothetical protein